MEWVQIISAVGFPIFACCAMGWYIKYNGDRAKEDRKESELRHKEEMDQVKGVMDQMREALNNNTLAITELSTYMKSKEVKK